MWFMEQVWLLSMPFYKIHTADQITTGSVFHASNVTDNRSDTASTSAVSTTQEMTQQSSSIWFSLTSSFAYWMSTTTTNMTIEMATMSTETTSKCPSTTTGISGIGHS